MPCTQVTVKCRELYTPDILFGAIDYENITDILVDFNTVGYRMLISKDYFSNFNRRSQRRYPGLYTISRPDSCKERIKILFLIRQRFELSLCIVLNK